MKKLRQAGQAGISVEGPPLLLFLWWIFSSNFRTWSSPKKAESRIAAVQAEHQVTRAQAIAIISGEMKHPRTRQAFQPLLNQYRDKDEG